MTTTKKTAAPAAPANRLTDDELGLLQTRAEERPRLAKRIQTYLRNVTRIHTLERVLDPDDVNAIGNPTSGNEESYRAEIARRQAELTAIVPELKRSLAAATEAPNGE